MEFGFSEFGHFSPLHVGISLRLALMGTLSGSLSVTLADMRAGNLLSLRTRNTIDILDGAT